METFAMMKLLCCAVSAMLGLSLLCPASYAGNVAYDNKVKPALALPEALVLAGKALGTGSKTFYCVSAKLERVGKDHWIIEYASPTGTERFVEVDFDKHVSSPPDAYRYRV